MPGARSRRRRSDPRWPLSPHVREPGAARGRRGQPARTRGRRRTLRRWSARGQRRRRRLGRGRMAVLRAVRRPRHHRRSLPARRSGRSRCAAQLPHATGEPGIRVRRWARRVAVSLRARRPRPDAARRGRRRRAPQRRGRCAGRRPAQRQPPVHEPAPGRPPARPTCSSTDCAPTASPRCRSSTRHGFRSPGTTSG